MRTSISILFGMAFAAQSALAAETCDVDYSLTITDFNKTLIDEGPLDSSQQFIPASTFKIPHTLIALDLGVLKGEGTEFEWDGIDRNYAPWNQDHTLASAFKVSCVWCYQSLVEKVGEEQYRHYLKLLNYGNQQLGSDLRTFWLDGDIRISPLEQIEFLKHVYGEIYPVSDESYETLFSIMKEDEALPGTLYGKTGWAGEAGWYVGFYEIKDNVYFFANQLRVEEREDLACRKVMVLDALQELKLMD
jgi:beta-lactamase class D